jgi:hypothetical protein
MQNLLQTVCQMFISYIFPGALTMKEKKEAAA